MIRGIGIDTAVISEMADIARGRGAARMFTAAELADSGAAADPAAYLAKRFAAKEAVFKAVAHLLAEKSFDLRLVETLSRGDGSPCITTEGPLRGILQRAGVARLFVSLTTEEDMATAVVIAEGDEGG